MTREGLIKHWEIIKAWKDGAAIEGRKFGSETWSPMHCPHFLDTWEYRIKPQYVWLNVCNHRLGDRLKAECFNTWDEAEYAKCNSRIGCIKVELRAEFDEE